jgi:hypothetical protein
MPMTPVDDEVIDRRNAIIWPHRNFWYVFAELALAQPTTRKL